MRNMRSGGTALAALLSSLVASCSSSNPVTPPTDAGTDTKRPVESGVKDVILEPLEPFDGHYSAGDASAGTGKQFQQGYGLVLYGVTSDGSVVYGNGSEVPTFYTAPLKGGAAVNLSPPVGAAYALVAGPVVFLFDDIEVDTPTYASPLIIWSAAGGLHTLTSSSFFENAAVSSDNKFLLYLDNYDSGGQTGDLYVAGIDGKNPTLLQSGLPGLTPGGACLPEFTFAGTTAIVSYCVGGSATNVNINTYAGATWAATNNITGASSLGYRTDPTNTNLLYTSAAGLDVVPLAGGVPVVIDPLGTAGAFTKDGLNVVYATSANNLFRSPVATPTPALLVTGGVAGIYGLSPDDSTALVLANGTQLTDLYTASAATPGALTTLDGAASASVPGFGLFYGDAFTADSSEVLFYTGVTASPFGTAYGTLNAAVASSAATTKLSSSSTTVVATTGTKVAFADNMNYGAITTCDIKAVDVKGGTPTLITHAATSGANAAFLLSPDKTQIIYSWTNPGSESGGLYLAPVP
jgi:hypothetical protein